MLSFAASSESSEIPNQFQKLLFTLSSAKRHCKRFWLSMGINQVVFFFSKSRKSIWALEASADVDLARCSTKPFASSNFFCVCFLCTVKASPVLLVFLSDFVCVPLTGGRTFCILYNFAGLLSSASLICICSRRVLEGDPSNRVGRKGVGVTHTLTNLSCVKYFSSSFNLCTVTQVKENPRPPVPVPSKKSCK